MGKAIGACFARAVNLRPVEHLSIITASMRLKNAKEERAAADEKNGEENKKTLNKETRK